MTIRGWVYVLTNKAMPGLLKVGFSTKDPVLRANELEGTGLPHPYEVAYDVLVEEPRDVEQAVHRELGDSHEAKEFFRIDVRTAINAIRSTIESQSKQILLETSIECDEPIAEATTVPKICSFEGCSRPSIASFKHEFFCQKHYEITRASWTDSVRNKLSAAEAPTIRAIREIRKW